MSSHREAPSISKDPVADNTDLYAFRTPSETVTIIANFLPSQAPNGGPNFYEFDDEVLYEIHVDNNGDALDDVTFQFRFKTVNTNPNTFLYNTGQIDTLDSQAWNRRQTYTLTRVIGDQTVQLGTNLPCPPVNIGPRSTPNYEAALASEAVKTLNTGGSTTTVFAGQRADPFFVDLGSIFDLGTLRPFQDLHLLATAAADGVDALAQSNVHTIAIQVPIASLTKSGQVPIDVMDPGATIGIYASASRQRNLQIKNGRRQSVGPWEQVSRLGNPLFNEVLVPLARKDEWNATKPVNDASFARYVLQPELAKLLPVLYPNNVFPNLAQLTADRADLAAILLTGIPTGVVPGFQNYTGQVQADLLRLNVAVPASTGSQSPFGLLGGDLDGYPNGRRLADDVTTIELRAVAGVTYQLVMPDYAPDGAATLIEDGTRDNPGRTLLGRFPYVGTPYSGYDVGS
ncbi:MAG: DUF4331 domain-containing protein [Ilumatobacteraceae bacterium]